MQDNNRFKTACLEENFVDAEAVQRIEWSACSPDHSLIDHAWVSLEQHVSARSRLFVPVQDLAITLLQIRNSILQILIDNLIAPHVRQV